MPAVNWVERGRVGDGNSVPRYHIVWGTSRELTRRMIAALREAGATGKPHPAAPPPRHRAGARDGRMAGALAVNEDTGAEVPLHAPVVVLAMGGINGGHAETRQLAPGPPAIPATMLNGAHPYADGAHAPLGGRCAGRAASPTPARCGTTPPAFRTRSRISRGTACPPSPASRRCG